MQIRRTNYSLIILIFIWLPVIHSARYRVRVGRDRRQSRRGITTSNPILFQLGKHDVYRDKITISGFSSGGSFAQQFFVSHSSLFTGIGTFSHSYYRCGPGSGREMDYDNACTIIGSNTTTTHHNLESVLDDIRSYEQRRLIDDTGNMRNKKLYVYAGTRSQLFSLDQSLAPINIFEPFIKNPYNIKTRIQDAGHLFPSDTYGSSCALPADDNFFIGNCRLSGAYDALSFLLGDFIHHPGQHLRSRPQASLLTFDQSEFFYGYSGEEYMDSQAYIYVPRHCHRTRCYLHIYFHGCLTGREFNGTDHIVNSGFLEVAEANNLIVLFPQALSSVENPFGCWDTYGLTGEYYATNRAPQITVVRNMLARILGLDNEVVPVSDSNPHPHTPIKIRESGRPIIKIRDREPLGIEFEIVKGREVYLRR